MPTWKIVHIEWIKFIEIISNIKKQKNNNITFYAYLCDLIGFKNDLMCF